MTYPVIIVGGGIAGLMVAYRLVMAGYQVILLEAQPRLGSQSSTHNHGWLHHSGRFYLLIHGMEVVEQCQQGAREILSIAPHCVDPCRSAYLVTADLDLARRYIQQCQKVGIDPYEVSVRDLYEREPALHGSQIQAAFAVSDLPFRPSAVLDALYSAIVEAGAEVYCGATVREFRCQSRQIVKVKCEQNGIIKEIPTSLVVNAAGAWSCGLLQTLGVDVPTIRLFQSSLLVVEPALTGDTMLLSMDAKGATAVPHGARTVVGVNGDSQPIEDPRERRSAQASIDTIIRGMTDLMPQVVERKSLAAFLWTCKKTEFVRDTNTRGRSPAYVVLDHSEHGISNLLTCFPGKFTTAPVMATAVANTVREMLPLSPGKLQVVAARGR